MAKISVLSKDISELIAAGEVIERPASVIKELLENSIDAGAKHITVEIKNGGTTYMRITDDGCGISPDQVATAFLRHATSKITSKDDLDNILTLGFRGEALASVAAVSRVEVLTKQRGCELGTNYIIEGSIEHLYEQTGCPDGTTIIIRDIFFNVPVRQKFMKRDSAEANAIMSIMQKIVLSHPDIAFRFIKDNKPEFNSAGDGELYSAIYAVYGSNFAHDLLPVDYEENGITVKGFTVKPLYSKSNRAFQNFFINGRYVKSLTCMAAIEEAYKNLIMVGKFPACVLMLTAPPSTVDVNVHPAKAEVRFSDEKLIFNSVYFAIKNTLMASGLIYDFQIEKDSSVIDYKRPLPKPEKFIQPKLSEPSREKKQDFALENSGKCSEPESEAREFLLASPKLSYGEVKKFSTENNASPPEEVKSFSYINSKAFERREEPKPEKTAEEKIPIGIIGEAFKNYIIAQAGDSIIIIDKHAAHERVIFERLKSQNNTSDSQLVINGAEILLSLREYSALRENTEKLESMGFKLDFSHEPYVKPLAVPSILDSLNMDEVIPEIAENFYMCKVDPQTHILDDMFHDLACKAAIKSGDKNDKFELLKLAEEVFYNENIRHCPHGRPVMFVLTKRDIEKQFKRII